MNHQKIKEITSTTPFSLFSEQDNFLDESTTRGNRLEFVNSSKYEVTKDRSLLHETFEEEKDGDCFPPTFEENHSEFRNSQAIETSSKREARYESTDYKRIEITPSKSVQVYPPCTFTVSNNSLHPISVNSIEIRNNLGKGKPQINVYPASGRIASKKDLVFHVNWNVDCPASPPRFHNLEIIFRFLQFSISRFVKTEAGDPLLDILRPRNAYLGFNDNEEALKIPPVIRTEVPLAITSHKNMLKVSVSSEIPLELNTSLEVFSDELSVENYRLYFSTLLCLNVQSAAKILARYLIQNVQPINLMGTRAVFPYIPDHIPFANLKNRVVCIRLKSEEEEEKEDQVCFIYGRVISAVDHQVEVEFLPKNIAILKKTTKYTIEFCENRYSANIAHSAICEASEQRCARFLRSLFVESPHLMHPAREYHGKYFGESPTSLQKLIPEVLGDLNAQQLQAVYSILNRTYQAPFILFGPPGTKLFAVLTQTTDENVSILGTGKTKTLVAAVLVLLLANKHNKILISAPSNVACGVVFDKLSESTKEGLQPPVWIKSLSSEGDCLQETTLSELKMARVIIATCVTSVRSKDIATFSHIFLDEASQATEPESIIPFVFNWSPHVGMILAGDHKQLRPVVEGPETAKYGLNISLLERLMMLPHYQDLDDNEMSIMLVQNYRADPALLRVPSKLFYNDQLVPMRQYPNRVFRSLVNSELPMIIHHIDGLENRAGKIPSYFNNLECLQVLNYLKFFRDEFDEVKSAEDIMILSPYQAQVKKIGDLLKMEGFEECQVGSVEQFQGTEREIVIISTVRSSSHKKHNENPHENLGFLQDSHRFNVAVTRAKSLLIVIGNTFVLKSDPAWRVLIDDYLDHDGLIKYGVKKGDELRLLPESGKG